MKPTIYKTQELQTQYISTSKCNC